MKNLNFKSEFSFWKLTMLCVCLLLFFSSCRRSKNLIDPSEFAYNPKGLTVLLYYKKGHFKKGYKKGELISVESDVIFIKNKANNKIEYYNAKDIQNLKLYAAYVSDFPGRGVKDSRVINSIIGITHGWWGILTIPISHLVITAESSRKYVIKYPNNVGWKNLSKFARFPTGIPKTIDILEL